MLLKWQFTVKPIWMKYYERRCCAPPIQETANAFLIYCTVATPVHWLVKCRRQLLVRYFRKEYGIQMNVVEIMSLGAAVSSVKGWTPDTCSQLWMTSCRLCRFSTHTFCNCINVMEKEVSRLNYCTIPCNESDLCEPTSTLSRFTIASHRKYRALPSHSPSRSIWHSPYGLIST